jgi:hypothetical protein
MAVSKSTEKITNIIVSAGAAVVIFGAWAKSFTFLLPT